MFKRSGLLLLFAYGSVLAMDLDQTRTTMNTTSASIRDGLAELPSRIMDLSLDETPTTPRLCASSISINSDSSSELDDLQHLIAENIDQACYHIREINLAWAEISQIWEHGNDFDYQSRINTIQEHRGHLENLVRAQNIDPVILTKNPGNDADRLRQDWHQHRKDLEEAWQNANFCLNRLRSLQLQKTGDSSIASEPEETALPAHSPIDLMCEPEEIALLPIATQAPLVNTPQPLSQNHNNSASIGSLQIPDSQLEDSSVPGDPLCEDENSLNISTISDIPLFDEEQSDGEEIGEKITQLAQRAQNTQPDHLAAEFENSPCLRAFSTPTQPVDTPTQPATQHSGQTPTNCAPEEQIVEIAAAIAAIPQELFNGTIEQNGTRIDLYSKTLEKSIVGFIQKEGLRGMAAINLNPQTKQLFYARWASERAIKECYAQITKFITYIFAQTSEIVDLENPEHLQRMQCLELVGYAAAIACNESEKNQPAYHIMRQVLVQALLNCIYKEHRICCQHPTTRPAAPLIKELFKLIERLVIASEQSSKKTTPKSQSSLALQPVRNSTSTALRVQINREQQQKLGPSCVFYAIAKDFELCGGRLAEYIRHNVDVDSFVQACIRDFNQFTFSHNGPLAQQLENNINGQLQYLQEHGIEPTAAMSFCQQLNDGTSAQRQLLLNLQPHNLRHAYTTLHDALLNQDKNNRRCDNTSVNDNISIDEITAWLGAQRGLGYNPHFVSVATLQALNNSEVSREALIGNSDEATTIATLQSSKARNTNCTFIANLHDGTSRGFAHFVHGQYKPAENLIIITDSFNTNQAHIEKLVQELEKTLS